MTLFLSLMTLMLFLTIAALVVTLRALLALSDRVSSIEKILLEEFTKPEKKETNIENEISSGLIKNLQKIKNDDKKHLKLIDMSRKNQFSKSFNTDGELIPVNLSDKELNILKLFYDKRNE